MSLRATTPAPSAASRLPLSDAARQRTMRLSVVEGSVWAIMLGFGETFTSPFLIFLKASNWAIALLTTGPLLLGALAQLAGAWIVERTGRRRTLLTATAAAHALMYAPLFLVPTLFPTWAVPAAVTFALLASFCGNLPLPAWMSLMGDVIPEASRGDYMGRRYGIIFFCLTAANLLAGFVLGGFERANAVWTGFGCLFGIALLARLTSSWLLSRHDDPPYQPGSEDYFSFWSFLRRTPQSNFAKFSFFVALTNGAANISAPFFNVYMLRDLHWTYTQFTVNIVTMFVAQALFFRWWGRIGDRHGHRAVLVATGCLLPVLPIIWALTSNYYILLGQQVLSGATWSGFNLATQNFIFDAVPPRRRARSLAYFSVINGSFILLGGTVIGAWLATQLPNVYRIGPLQVAWLSSLPAVFIISGALRLLTLLLLVPQFKEVRPTEPISPGTLLLRMWSVEAFTGAFGDVFLRVGSVLRRRR